jgi:hypothetical protein|eukprot:COSAG06_NODE_6169_length_3071_cov_1.593203_1_plen_107_part_00
MVTERAGVAAVAAAAATATTTTMTTTTGSTVEGSGAAGDSAAPQPPRLPSWVGQMPSNKWDEARCAERSEFALRKGAHVLCARLCSALRRRTGHHGDRHHHPPGPS